MEAIRIFYVDLVQARYKSTPESRSGFGRPEGALHPTQIVDNKFSQKKQSMMSEETRATHIHSILHRRDGCLAVTVEEIKSILEEIAFLSDIESDEICASVVIRERERAIEREQSVVIRERERAIEREQAIAWRERECDAAYKRGLQHSQSTRLHSGETIHPPQVSETTASSLDNSSPEHRAKKLKYDNEILPTRLYENSFVHVKSYFRFVEGCALAINQEKSPSDAAIHCFGIDAVNTWCPVENLTGLNEVKRSVALSRAFGKELRDELSLDVQHQIPISPNQKKLKQQADVCFFLQPDDGLEARVVAELEYKTVSNFIDYESQAGVYATDIMNIVNSPILVIQAHGADLQIMQFRVFGVVHAKMTNDSETHIQNTTAQYRKTLVYEGQGHSAFAAIAEGLRHCAAGVRSDRSFDSFNLQNKVSSVASILEDNQVSMFVKSYDYRIRSGTLKQNRRHANIELVRRFIDKDAKHFEMGENLEVVVTRFYQLDEGKTAWYSEFSVRNLCEILADVASLHTYGFVHGDIRLFNLLLHVGKLVDFDHARRVGAFYANTLQRLTVDGKRAEAVELAIANESLSTLQMEFDHDLESLKYVLSKFQPTRDAPHNFCEWWRTRVRSINYSEVLSLRSELIEYSDYRLECDISIKSYLNDQARKMGEATDSPRKD
jgi:hypothetical protein